MQVPVEVEWAWEDVQNLLDGIQFFLTIFNLNVLSCPFNLNGDLHEPADVRPQSFLLALDDFSQSNFNYWSSLSGSKVHGEPFIEISTWLNALVR